MINVPSLIKTNRFACVLGQGRREIWLTPDFMRPFVGLYSICYLVSQLLSVSTSQCLNVSAFRRHRLKNEWHYICTCVLLFLWVFVCADVYSSMRWRHSSLLFSLSTVRVRALMCTVTNFFSQHLADSISSYILVINKFLNHCTYHIKVFCT